MGDVLSQSDLDALFGDSAPAKSENSALSQSDLDALFGDITSAGGPDTEGASAAAEAPEGLNLAQPGQDAGSGPSSHSESMSQDEIDKLLAEFLG